MKATIYRLLIAAAFTATATIASAQASESGYFVDGYSYRYTMNPAFGNDRNFVSIPGIANLNIGMHGNLPLTSVLYNVDGRTTTFLNPGVATSTVLANIKNVNKIGSNDAITILAGGFKAWGGYNTVTIGAKVDADVSLPRSIFSLLKEGVANKTYDISDINARANAYAEIAFGHSRNFGKQWRVGATFKFLIGGANVNAELRNTQLNLGVDDWSITADADIHASVKGMRYDTKLNDRTGHRYVSGAKVDNAGVGGFGMAFDLGAEYTTPVKGLRVSAALLDLGFICWSDDVWASTNGVKSFNTDRYTFSPDDDAPNSFSNEFDRMRDDLSALYELEDMGNVGGRTTALRATMNIGAEYELPWYRKLTFGLLNTTRIAGNFTTTDFRISANVAPCKVFSAGINMVAGTYGVGFGWLANVHVTGCNFFIGMDRTPGKLAKQGVPLNSNLGVNFGLNVLF